ncbi:hypothetical protein [Pseudomonas viridiflava]|uniref:hypothetical protein n=1 Tax=Pseudomonas viridiflava TaxID=33069 RepID=UPI000F014139|nr:hypothetical protein [Pseudomonas viridiflava]
MSTTTSHATGAKKKKKNQPAPPELVKAVGALFDIAAKAPPPLQLQAMTRDKLYEMLVLARLLRAFRRAHPKGSIIHRPPSKGGKPSEVVVASKPALADRKRFSHFDLLDAAGQFVGEAWTSVEFESLSWAHNGGTPGKAPRQARHELDVCVLEPGAGERPSHLQVFAGISCKDVRSSSKENVREALGLRRETAFLQPPMVSLAPWLVAKVPAEPSAPILLISSDVGVRKYSSPVDALGVYVRFVRRPWEAEV